MSINFDIVIAQYSALHFKFSRYLCEQKADYGAITHGDIQTPLHYAAKNDAHFSCINLVDNG